MLVLVEYIEPLPGCLKALSKRSLLRIALILRYRKVRFLYFAFLLFSCLSASPSMKPIVTPQTPANVWLPSIRIAHRIIVGGGSSSFRAKATRAAKQLVNDGLKCRIPSFSRWLQLEVNPVI